MRSPGSGGGDGNHSLARLAAQGIRVVSSEGRGRGSDLVAKFGPAGTIGTHPDGGNSLGDVSGVDVDEDYDISRNLTAKEFTKYVSPAVEELINHLSVISELPHPRGLATESLKNVQVK